MDRILANPPVLEDFLDSEIGALERLAAKVLARHLGSKKPNHFVKPKEVAMVAGD